ncbi:fructosamine kinase family protein [Ekhidna sp.]|uniref:fructosamine kinase family protein n=1 Tax=Ekhidna sp. TaxID=2608089 RepID=UPI0032981152
MNDFIDHILKKHLSPSICIKTTSSVSGGCVNSTYKISTDTGSYFLKWNKASLNGMFISEEKGLDLLHKYSPIITPKPLGKGVISEKSYLLTEWIEQGIQSSRFWENFGNNLAKQHQNTATKFGLDHDNFIGSLAQSNAQHSSWNDFFIQERLVPQLRLAESKNLISNSIQVQFEMLYSKLDELIPPEQPALLHGDLWSGNFMINQTGEAAIFDPAVYYGHRETELAFTKLFGGFSSEFYHHYNEAHPMEQGFDSRVDIHNLYPLLVHVNLFGTSYLSGIIQTLNRFT